MSYNIQSWEWAQIIRALQFHFWPPFEHSSCTEWQLSSQSSGLVAELHLVPGFWGLGCAHLYRLALWTRFQWSDSGNVWIPPSRSRTGSQSWHSRCSGTSCAPQALRTRSRFQLDGSRWQLGDKKQTQSFSRVTGQKDSYKHEKCIKTLMVVHCNLFSQGKDSLKTTINR